MTHWNYRGVVDREGLMSIREVFYDDDGTIDSFSINPTYALGESPEELIEVLGMMLKGLKEPFLKETDFFSEDSDDMLEEVLVDEQGKQQKQVH